MSMVRLLSAGTLLEPETIPVENPSEPSGNPTGDPTFIDRPAVIVYVGEFQSMDGPVLVTEDDIRIIEMRHNSFLEKMKRLLKASDVPIRMCPPIQTDHSTSAMATVGRLIGPVIVKDYEVDEGILVPALYGTLRILGKENVDRVVDGRFSNLSIGADFKIGKLSEVSITPFPAAEKAQMLSKDTGGKNMDQFKKSLKHHFAGIAHHLESVLDDKGMKAHMKSFEALTGALEGDKDSNSSLTSHMESVCKQLEGVDCSTLADHATSGLKHHLDGLRRHLEYGGQKAHVDSLNALTQRMAAPEAVAAPAEGEAEKPTTQAASSTVAPDADKDKLTEEKKDDKKDLTDKKSDEKKDLASDEKKDEKSEEKKLSAIQAELKKISESHTRLAQDMRKAHISGNLTRLQAARKISPAEMKAINVDELSKESDATVKAVLKSYESRQPIILSGVFGTKGAEDISHVAKEARIQRLMAEARSNMPMKRAEMEHRLKSMTDEQKEDKLQGETEKEVNIHIDAVPGGEHDTEMSEIEKLMGEGKLDEAKQKMKNYMAKMKQALSGSSSTESVEMSGIADNMKRLQTDMNNLFKLAGVN